MNSITVESGMVKLQELIDVVKDLHPGQIDLLLEMAQSMKKNIQENISDKSDILVSSFTKNFSNRLIIHHATHEQNFKKKAFEYAFCAASISSGKKARIISDQTNPGADVIVDGEAFSLKTEGSKDIREKKITISKLMEARWIRECKTSRDFALETTTRVVDHLNRYERILILRSFDLSENFVRYDLAEIPLSLLLRIGKLTANDFTPRTKSGGSSAPVKHNGMQAFTLRLDGSVEKVTISNLRIDLCIKHGSWTIPNSKTF